MVEPFYDEAEDIDRYGYLCCHTGDRDSGYGAEPPAVCSSEKL